MKANELRIGNLVKYKNEFRIKDELRNKDHVIIADDIVALLDGYDVIEGVTLTEEWLLKFGFEKEIIDQGNQKVDGYWKDSIMMLPRPNNPDFWYAAPYGYPINADRTLYVHQLQNLYFALTGAELTLPNQMSERV